MCSIQTLVIPGILIESLFLKRNIEKKNRLDSAPKICEDDGRRVKEAFCISATLARPGSGHMKLLFTRGRKRTTTFSVREEATTHVFLVRMCSFLPGSGFLCLPSR